MSLVCVAGVARFVFVVYEYKEGDFTPLLVACVEQCGGSCAVRIWPIFDARGIGSWEGGRHAL